ncbi:O-antigen ligase family protein [Roseobacter sp.]|uniref:O-antigen ligase family protein n=1 Tax=Roseobacter sp. TaxID=1907202 RepID=UPI003859735A
MTSVLLFLVLASLPLSSFFIPLGPAELNPSEILLTLLFVTIIARSVLIAGPIRVPRKLRSLASCAAALALAAMVSGIMSGNLTTAIRLGASVLFALLTAIACYRFGPALWTKPVLIGVALAISIAFGHLVGWVPLMEFERVSGGVATSGILQTGYTGLVHARGEYGILLLLGMASAMIGLRGKWRWLFVLAVLFAGLITVSRSTWIALATTSLVMAVLIWLPGKTLSGRLKALALYLTAIAVFVAPAAYFGLFTWLQERFTLLVGLRASSFDNRIEQFSYFFTHSDGYFWFGGGNTQFLQTFGYAIHNTQMSVFLAFGILPALFYCVLFLGAIWQTLKMAARSRDTRAQRQASVLLAVMCGCFIEASLYPKSSSMIMWALIGIAWGHTAYLRRGTRQPYMASVVAHEQIPSLPQRSFS